VLVSNEMALRHLMAIGGIAVLVALLGAPSVSLAYERRTIAAGKYDLVVGWDTEPPFVNQKNAAGIRISRAGTNPSQPVTGAEKTLKLGYLGAGLGVLGLLVALLAWLTRPSPRGVGKVIPAPSRRS